MKRYYAVFHENDTIIYPESNYPVSLESLDDLKSEDLIGLLCQQWLKKNKDIPSGNWNQINVYHHSDAKPFDEAQAKAKDSTNPFPETLEKFNARFGEAVTIKTKTGLIQEADERLKQSLRRYVRAASILGGSLFITGAATAGLAFEIATLASATPVDGALIAGFSCLIALCVCIQIIVTVSLALPHKIKSGRDNQKNYKLFREFLNQPTPTAGTIPQGK